MGQITFNYTITDFPGLDGSQIEKIYKVGGYGKISDARTELWDANSNWTLAGEAEWATSVVATDSSGNGMTLARAFKFKPGVVVEELQGWANDTTTLASLRRWTLGPDDEVSGLNSSNVSYGGARRNVTIDGQEFDLLLVIYQPYSTSSQRPNVRWTGHVGGSQPEPEPEPLMIPIKLIGPASINPNVSSFDATLPWACTVIPESGKVIDSIKVYKGYEDAYGNPWDTSMGSWINGDKIQVPENSFAESYEYLKIVVTEKTAPDPTTFSPVWDSYGSKNYTRSADSVDTTDGQGVIHLYPKSGYKITDVSIEVMDYYGNFTGSYVTGWTINNGNGTFDIVVPQGEGSFPVGVDVFTVALPPEDRTIAQSLYHCTSNIEVTTVPHGSAMEFTSGDKFVVTADSNYEFQSADDLKIVIDGTVYGPDTITFPTNELSCSLVDWTSITADVVITAIAHNTEVLPDPTEMSLGFVNIYNPTADEMREAGSKQYIGSQGTISMAQYILKAFRIYATPKVTDQKQEIMWGIYHTGVSSYVIVEPYVTLECGSVVVPEIYGNCLDYSPAVNIQLYLPFIGIVNVDTSDIVDKNCTLTYKVDVLTGNCLASLSCNGIVMYAWTGSMAENIPLTVSRVDTVNTQLGAEAVLMMGRTPFFIVKRAKPLNDDQSSRLDLDAEFWSVLGDLEGYTECLYVSVDGMTATSVEKAEIERLLKAGVII